MPETKTEVLFVQDCKVGELYFHSMMGRRTWGLKSDDVLLFLGLRPHPGFSYTDANVGFFLTRVGIVYLKLTYVIIKH